MSTYTQDTETITGYDIVTLKKGNHTIIPITTAEAVVWHEEGSNMTLRKKIESLQYTPGEPTTSYTAGPGIDISGTEISVAVDNDTIEIQNNKLSVVELDKKISTALSSYLQENPLINTEIITEFPENPNYSTLYLKKSLDSSAPDSFEEYIWVRNTNNWEKLGTAQLDASKLEKVYNVIFETVSENEINKFKKVYEVVFSEDSNGKEVNNIGENSGLINKISTELGSNDDEDTTIYGRLNKLETDYNNIAGLSFKDTGYKLKYEFKIEDLYPSSTSN